MYYSVLDNKMIGDKMEIWKDIKGYEGYYQISNFGRVKSLDRIVKRNSKFGNLHLKEKILVPTSDKDGYLCVMLHRKNKVIRSVKVHRLVANHFIPNPENKSTVNHKDGNKINNNINNLEWATRSEQTQHAYKLGLNNSKVGLSGDSNYAYGKRGDLSYNAIPVYQLDKNTNKIISEYGSMVEAAKQTGCNVSKISMVCAGKRITTGGYKWKYKR